MVICAGKSETLKGATTIGIGMIESAMNLTKKLLDNNMKAENIIFVGTAGSYGRAHVMNIYESSLSSNVELSFLDENSYAPLDNAVGCESNFKLVVNSSNYITTSEKHAKIFVNLNIDLENMEFYSIMKVADNFNIPCYGIFIVTNYCNDSAHQDFIKNHKEAKIKLEQYMKEKNII